MHVHAPRGLTLGWNVRHRRAWCPRLLCATCAVAITHTDHAARCVDCHVVWHLASTCHTLSFAPPVALLQPRATFGVRMLQNLLAEQRLHARSSRTPSIDIYHRAHAHSSHSSSLALIFPHSCPLGRVAQAQAPNNHGHRSQRFEPTRQCISARTAASFLVSMRWYACASCGRSVSVGRRQAGKGAAAECTALLNVQHCVAAGQRRCGKRCCTQPSPKKARRQCFARK